MASEDEWERVEITADSGAADMVGPEAAVKAIETQANEASRTGKYYIAAIGGKLMNQGEKKLVGESDEGVPMKMIMQVAEVHKLLGSVGKMTETGNVVTFGRKE